MFGHLSRDNDLENGDQQDVQSSSFHPRMMVDYGYVHKVCILMEGFRHIVEMQVCTIKAD